MYGDENIRDYTPESWRNRIAIVPQDPALFSATIAENSLSFFLLLSRIRRADRFHVIQLRTVDQMLRGTKLKKRPNWQIVDLSIPSREDSRLRLDLVELN